MEVIVYQDKTTAMIYSVLMIIVGLLFVLNKDLALSWGFIIAGVFLIIAGIIVSLVTKAPEQEIVDEFEKAEAIEKESA